MENIFDRLQFVKGLNPDSENGVFETREAAINYVLSKHIVERPSLLAEPIVLLYKSDNAFKGPNVILAIGSVGKGTASQTNRTFFIDTQKTEEEIEELREELEKAIKSLTLVPLESDTIEMHAEKTEDGTLVSGDVKIADYRIISGNVVDNIIETEGDKGIYTFVDMDYDPETFRITFRTTKQTKEFQLPTDQHVVKGEYSFADEAIILTLADGSKVEIDVVKLIDEWTVLPDSETPVLLYKEHVSSFTDSHEGVYDWQDVLTADVRVADHIGDNIIHKDRTGRYLYVKGTADNIKYSEGVTVKEAIDRIDTRVSTSEGNLIYKRSDGIYAYAMLDYKQAENKLVYKYTDGNSEGIKTVEFQLNSVKVLEDITYDPVKEVIVIRYIDAQGEYQKVEIPVKDIIEEWIVSNEGHNVYLDKYRSEGQGKDILTADVKIHNGDNNILEDKDHTLYVNGIANNIKYDATGETTVKNVLDTLKSEDERIEEKLDDEIARSTAEDEKIETTIGTGFSTDAHKTITYKFEQLQDQVNSEAEKLQNEIDRSTSKDEEHDAAISGEVAARTADIERIDTTIGSGFSTDAHETITYKFDELQTQVNSEADKLQAEIDRSISADTIHDGRLDAIDAEIGEGFGPRNTVRDEIENLQSEIDAVSADSSSRLSDVINEDESIDVETRNDAAGKATIKVVKVNLSDEVEDEKPNIIKLNADGLYAGVDLSYVEEANKLIFKTTNGTKEIQLDSMSSIIDIRYDASKEALIITYMTNGHEIKTVEIPVGDLIREWKPSENTDGAIKLTLTEAPSGTTGKDILYGEVLISDHEDNILINDGGKLYVSNSDIEANTAAIEALEGRMDAAEADINALEEGLREESSARTLADEALGRRIDQEIEDRTADVDAEESRAISAETTLSNKIDTDILAEKNRAISAETALQEALNREIHNREDDVDAEESRAKAAELALSNKIDTDILAEQNRAISAETALDAKIVQEVADRQADVDAEQSRAEAAELALSNKIDADVLAEKNRAISAETALNTKINQETVDRQADVLAEKNRAISAETALDSKINQEVADRQADVDAEESRAISAETALSNKIDADILTEKNRAISAETALDSKINQETTNRIADVDAEQSRAEAAETALSNKIDADVLAEKNRAISAETALDAKIDQEIANRIADVDAEETRATTEEARILHLLEDEISRSTDKDNEQDAKILQNANDILAEIARAEGAENVISGNVIAEETRATTEETAIRTTLNTEISNRTTADETLAHSIADEEERRISGDTILQTNIAGEEARAREIETRLETWLNDETARAEAKEGELNVAITNETIRANAADSELYQKISDVSASSIASDAQLQIKINEESSARTLADNALEDKIDDEIYRSTQKDDALTLALQDEIADREQGDADLAEAIREATLSFNDTTSIDFTKSSGNVVTADVKLQEGDNIIKLGQGLYATAHLSYDTGTNKIKLTTTAGEEEYQLAGATVIDNLEYDSTNKELVITYHDGNGGVHTVRFGVSELFNEWGVQNPSENSAIELIKTTSTTPGGEDKLSGRVLLTNLEDNAIQIVNNGLYVSATDMGDAKEIALCVKNELSVLERAVIGHKIYEECGSGYTYEPNVDATYISGATNFYNADFKLDQNLKRVEGKIDDAAISATCIDSKANKIYELLYGEGMTMPPCGEGSHYQPYVGACIISGATSFNEADQMLNDQICEILTMWTSGQTCTSNSDWVEDGANRRIEIDVRLSRGKYAEMTDEDIFIEKLESPLEYIDPTNTEFTDTNVLRIACINEGPSGTTPSVASMQNGIYLSNEWDCGLYYDASDEHLDAEAKAKAEAAGYRTDPYSTDEASGASNYNYNNNVRQTPTP